MRHRIDLPQGRTLVRSRSSLCDAGLTDRQIRTAVESGDLLRLHRGAYASAEEWAQLWPEGRHLLKVLAVRSASPGSGPVFTHASAAVLWGLPLHGVGDLPVQVLVDGARHSRITAGVVRRDMRVAEGDIVRIDGIRVTSPNRTVFDVARSMREETGVACADAALRRASVIGQTMDADAAAAWHENVMSLALPGLRGVRRARRVIEFADGRAQLPGESVSRLQLDRLGYSNVGLQVPVTGSAGDSYWLDFAFRRSRAFGEFDGAEKYTDAALRAGATEADVVLREKRREDDIRGVTGWRFARWGYEHIGSPDALGSRLAAFGIHSPG